MKQIVKTFLEFNGKTLLFVSQTGTYWIAIKPVCESLNVDYIRQFKNIQQDPILGPALSKQTIQVPNDQAREYACLPENWVYGWIFSIKSDSKELLEYKKECYDILYNHFHGEITQRKDLLKQKAELRVEREKIRKLLEQDENFCRYESLIAEESLLGKSLKELDNNEISVQLSLFTSELS